MKAPTHLKHKPIVSVDDYEDIDGKYAGNTDAKALSLGWAQYDADELSLKTWRMGDRGWSRMSEELPIHRNLDLTILFLKTLIGDERTKLHFNHDHGNEQDILDYYEANKEYLEPRLKEIKELLNKMEL